MSMFRPTNPSMAGKSVMDAIMVTNTAAAAPTAIPWTNWKPMRSRPRSEITTMVPAKITARPAVVSATIVDSRGSRPSWSPCR